MSAFEYLKTQADGLVFDRNSEHTVEAMRQRIEELPVRSSSAEAASDTLLKGVAELSFSESGPTLFTDEYHSLQIQWAIDNLGICITLEVIDSESYNVSYVSTNDAAVSLQWSLVSEHDALTMLSTFAHLLKQLSDSSAKDITS